MSYIFHFRDLMPYLGMFAEGLRVTVSLAAIALAASLALALPAAFGRVFGPRWLRAVLVAWIELARNTPFLIQLFFIYFGFGSLGLRFTPFTASVIALTFNFSAYFAEILRAGIVSLPKGQTEAARVLGMTQVQILRDILLRPMLGRVWPALCAQMNLLVLGTSVASAVSVDELTGVSMVVASNTYRSFEVFSVMALVYLILTLVVALALKLAGFAAFRWQRV